MQTRTDYVLLEFATFASGTANGAVALILPWLVLDRTGSPVAVGAVVAATTVPLVLGAVAAGAVVDRTGRRRSAAGAELASGLAVLAVVLIDQADALTMGALVVLAGLGAALDQAGVLARESMVPALAQRAGLRLEGGNGVHEAVWGVSLLAGPAVGGVLVATVGAMTALGVVVAGFALAGTAMVAVRDVGVPDVRVRDVGAAPPVRTDFLRSCRDGVTAVRQSPLLTALALLSAGLAVAYVPIQALVLPVHFHALHEPGRLGVLLAVIGLGGVAGAVLYGVVGHRVSRYLLFRGAVVAAAGSVVVVALLPPYPLLLAAAFLLGLAYGPVGPLTNLAVQTAVPDDVRARTIGTFAMLTNGAGPLGVLLAGPLLSALSVRPTVLLLAGLLVVVAVVAVMLPALRGFDLLTVPTPENGVPG